MSMWPLAVSFDVLIALYGFILYTLQYCFVVTEMFILFVILIALPFYVFVVCYFLM